MSGGHDGPDGGGADHVRPGRERAWRFLRTLVGLLLVAWLVAALVAPPDPTAFLAWLVPAWAAAFPAAWYLVYRDGYATLRTSDRYAPGLPAGTALASFVVVALGLKLAATLALNAAVGDRAHLLDVGVSLLALATAAVAVYGGVLARAAGRSGDRDAGG